MSQTIIQRLRRLGYAVHSSPSPEGEGLLIRSIGRARCTSCEKAHLYVLEEIVSEKVRVLDKERTRTVMEWFERISNPLGSFCNSCGAFSWEEGAEPCGIFARRLRGVRDIGMVLSDMEASADRLSGCTLEELEKRKASLEGYLETVRHLIASRKGYRD